MGSKTSSDNFEPVGLSAFFGGMSVDNKLGSSSQFYYGRHLDFRKNPSTLSVLPGPRRADNGIVNDLAQDMTQLPSGIRYALGNLGGLYKVTTAGDWSDTNIGENGGAGIIYRADVDHMYMTGQTKIARLARANTAPNEQFNWFTDGPSTCTTCTKSAGPQTYTLPTAITESKINQRLFTSDIDPISRLAVYLKVKGTGDWTLTLHDDANTVLGTVTITNSNLVTGKNYFRFSTPVRIQRGDNGAGSALTYHFHLTSTVADGTVSTTTSNSLEDCDMELWGSALVTTQNALHPVINFSNLTLFGNGRYVAAYEPLQDNPQMNLDYTPHRLTFPPGFEVCGFAQKNLMVVIGVEKRSTTGEFQEGALFFWDGISDTYIDWWPVPEGSPESLFSSENTVYYVANGVLYQIQGTDQPIKLRTIRNTDSEFSNAVDNTHSYPNMMTVRRGILLVGYPSYTTVQTLEHGVYSYGSISREYPVSFGFSYTTSNGNILNNGSNNLRLGMVKSYGDVLYISWRDDSVSPHTYGVDIVDNFSTPATAFSFQPLLFDDGRAYAYKNSGYMIATFDPWPSDATLTLKYKLDNDSDWTYSTQSPASGDQYIVIPVDRRFLVANYGFDGTAVATTPSINSFYMWVDPLSNERPVGN